MPPRSFDTPAARATRDNLRRMRGLGVGDAETLARVRREVEAGGEGRVVS